MHVFKDLWRESKIFCKICWEQNKALICFVFERGEEKFDLNEDIKVLGSYRKAAIVFVHASASVGRVAW